MKIWKIIQIAQKQNPYLLAILILVTVISSFIQATSSITVVPVIDLMIHPDLKQASQATITILSWLDKFSIPRTLFWMIILFLIVTVIKNIITAISKYILTHIRQQMVKNLILEQYRAFMGSNWAFFVSHKHGMLSSSIITETEKVGITFQTLGDMANCGLCVIFYLGVGFYISWKITVMVVLLTLCGLVPVFLVGKRIGQFGKVATEQSNEFQGTIMESFQAAKLILGYGNQRKSYEKLASIVDPLISVGFKHVIIRLVTPLAFEPVGFAVILLAVYLGWNCFHLKVTEIFLLLYVFKMISQYALNAVDLRNYLKNISAGLEQIHDLHQEALKMEQVSGQRIFGLIKDKIVFQEICFSYPNNKQVLTNVNLTIPKGKMIAIVGRSGSGKTTLIDVLMGFYQPQSGHYFIDEIPFQEFDLNSWRKKIGYIPQDAFLFNMSIKDNLLWGNDTANQQEMETALELSNSNEFVQALPLKEDTIVGDHGVRLSGGQRQRIALARAILRKPQMLILDEATSSLDSHSELLIQNAIEKIAGDTTIVTIAHRLSTIRKADYIYVMDQGRVVEEGSFERLMEIKGGEFLKTAEIQGDLLMPGALFEQAVIFAGGRGERLRPLTDRIPKPMAPVNGRPFVDYLLGMLRDAGIRRVVFLLGYKAESVINHYKVQPIPGLDIDYSVGKEEDQTGRRLINAYEKLEEKFLLLYGDNYWPVPLEEMKKNYGHLQVSLTTTVFSNKNGTGEYGFGNNVMVDPNGKVKAYDKSRRGQGLNGVDIGFFLVDKNVIDPNETGNISFEEVILTRIASEGRLGAFLTDEQYYYITSFESLQRFEQIASQKEFRKVMS